MQHPSLALSSVYNQQSLAKAATWAPGYGAPTPQDGPIGDFWETPSAAKRDMRKVSGQVNTAAFCQCVFLPWILYVVIYAICSFRLRYDHAWLCVTACVVGFVAAPLLTGYAAFRARQRKRAGMASEVGGVSFQWLTFLTVSLILAWAAAVICGDVNFWSNSEPYYEVSILEEYPSVDPSTFRGQQLMDAGRIEFQEGSVLDTSLAMGFKNVDWYCVAPVVKGDTAPESYDFWAVGLNCCNGDVHSSNFQCGDYNNPNARSGLRLMREEERPYMRLVVKQAEAAYGIRAQHPIFFTWMEDPLEEMNAYRDDSVRYFLLGVFAFFACNLFCSIVALSCFPKS